MRRSAVIGPIRAFVRMGYLEAISYPMGTALGQIGTAIALLSSFFLSRIVHNGPSVGGSYFSFVLVGVIGQMAVAGAFQGIGVALDSTIQQGRLETVLIEPIRWPLIPIALGAWPAILQVIQIGVAICIGLLLGVRLEPGGAPWAALLVVMGLAVGLAMGLLAASIRILAKRSDPIWLVYSFMSALLSGAAIPINLLPLPLRMASWVLPSTYVIAGLRKLLMPDGAGVYGITVSGDLLIVSILTVILGALAATAFTRSLDAGRRLGVLAGY